MELVGIAGSSDGSGKMSRCTNLGEYKGSHEVDGFIGRPEGNGTEISDCKDLYKKD